MYNSQFALREIPDYEPLSHEFTRVVRWQALWERLQSLRLYENFAGW